MRACLLQLTAVVLVSMGGTALRAEEVAEPPEAVPAVRMLTGGDEIALGELFVPGYLNIFMFTNPYCGSCKLQKPKMVDLARTHPKILLVELDINRPDYEGEDWYSPLARQYGIDRTPFFLIYNPKGELDSKGRDAYLKVLQWHWLYVDPGPEELARQGKVPANFDPAALPFNLLQGGQ